MELQERIDLLVKKADEISAAYWQRMNFTFSLPPKHRAEYLSDKWCRILVTEERNGTYQDGSVYAFVCLKDNMTKALGMLKAGDIHKAATYKAPAKHARGNLFNELWPNCLTSTGIVYLK